MLIESHVSMDNEARVCPDNCPAEGGDAGVGTSASEPVLLQQCAKRPTRQWAAWTRQEEESFFTALRQVGKNFEKITRRVQSKNKDQVRHYYYRLVRRMNKLLGPGLCLDAKNSKDTNTAMLRWWSLLEKYSCKPSKLHLKPRRFKIFVEALEHQLLKDRRRNGPEKECEVLTQKRRKSVRKKSPQGGNSSPLSAASNQTKTSGNEGRLEKPVLVDCQNIQKGTGKPPLKRNVSSGKGDSTPKPARRRRRPAAVSSMAYKKWEKAAIAGVSLVADAAEHLERTIADKDDGTSLSTPAEKCSESVGAAPQPLPSVSPSNCIENNMQACVKLKLQLFPIDDGTRKALELDKHNPFLELTLSTKKKISSILEHLKRKWGSSSAASGDLILFPYGAQRENLIGCLRWTQDSVVTAADVYYVIGSPPLFRLRYGWITNAEIGQIRPQVHIEQSCLPRDSGNDNNIEHQSMESPLPSSSTNCQSKYNGSIHENRESYIPEEMNDFAALVLDDNMVKSSHTTPHASGNANATDKVIVNQTVPNDPRVANHISLSAGEWADSLTNISVGDLLLEVSQNMEVNFVNTTTVEIPQIGQPASFSCDSFDAAIAAHISRCQENKALESTLSSHASSIWDAEETCDAFSFQRNAVRKDLALPCNNSCEADQQIVGRYQSFPGSPIKKLPDVALAEENPCCNDDPMDECGIDQHVVDNQMKEFSGLPDICWPDLDLDIPSSKYYNEDLLLSDSLSGLNRLIASSLDAFQNCSFFALDKKEHGSTAEAK